MLPGSPILTTLWEEKIMHDHGHIADNYAH